MQRTLWLGEFYSGCSASAYAPYVGVGMYALHKYVHMQINVALVPRVWELETVSPQQCRQRGLILLEAGCWERDKSNSSAWLKTICTQLDIQ